MLHVLKHFYIFFFLQKRKISLVLNKVIEMGHGLRITLTSGFSGCKEKYLRELLKNLVPVITNWAEYFGKLQQFNIHVSEQLSF